jgi:hypothetical protein
MELDQVRIASPCRADWDAMQGDDRVRFCAECGKNVYNLSAMTRLEAEALVTEKEGRMCARFYQRADGSALTSDCPVGLRIKTVRVSRRIGFAFSGLLGFAAVAWAQSPMVPTGTLLEAIKAGGLSGVVVDQTGAGIPNSLVELREHTTGLTYSIRADEDGRFRFRAIAPGSYSLKVSSPGFKTSEKGALFVRSGRSAELEVRMEIGVATMGGPIAPAR